MKKIFFAFLDELAHSKQFLNSRENDPLLTLSPENSGLFSSDGFPKELVILFSCWDSSRKNDRDKIDRSEQSNQPQPCCTVVLREVRRQLNTTSYISTIIFKRLPVLLQCHVWTSPHTMGLGFRLLSRLLSLKFRMMRL